MPQSQHLDETNLEVRLENKEIYATSVCVFPHVCVKLILVDCYLKKREITFAAVNLVTRTEDQRRLECATSRVLYSKLDCNQGF